MSKTERQFDFWKAIRVLTTAPLMAAIALALLRTCREEIFSGEMQFLLLFFCLGLLPLLAYPLQRFFPHFKNQGRSGQRHLAMIFAVGGYLISMLVCVITRASKAVWFFCLEYLLSGLLIFLFNRIFHVKISGHVCGVAGPIMLLAYQGLWYTVPVGCAVLILVMVASLKTKRHTVPEMIGGGFAAMASFVILLSLFNA